MLMRLQRRAGGFSYLELLVAVMVVMILATAVIPLARWDEKRRREVRLRLSLEMMRNAIDQYHSYVEEGLVVLEDVEQQGWPVDLEQLIEGVEVSQPDSPDSQTVRFLQRIPMDPFTGDHEWGLRSYQDDYDSRSWGGENVYDVYSLSDLMALDGTHYSDW